MKKAMLFFFLFFMFLIGGANAQDSYLGEIRMVSFGFAPSGWALCNGQLLPINQNQALFSILGTTYGGNGQTTFALPDLRGKAGVDFNSQYVLGKKIGEEYHMLISSEMPAHSHTAINLTTTMDCSNAAGDKSTPSGNYPAVNTARGNEYSSTTNAKSGVISNSTFASPIGGSQPHNNLQPYIVVNYIISIQGMFPSRD